MAISDFRVITDVEKSIVEGLAPKRVRPPSNFEDLLSPLSVRERAVAVALNGALLALGHCEEAKETVAAWTAMLTAFKTLTGISWHDRPH